MDTTLRVIHDTIYVKGADALDILNKTNEFYDSAWYKLIAFGSMVFVVVPILLQYYQRQLIISDKREIKKEIDEAISAFKKEIGALDNKVKASTHYSEGLIQHRTSHWTLALISMVRAAWYFLACEEYQNAKVSLNFVEDCFSKTSKSELRAAGYMIGGKVVSIKDVFIKMSEMDKAYTLQDRLRELVVIYEALPEKRNQQ